MRRVVAVLWVVLCGVAALRGQNPQSKDVPSSTAKDASGPPIPDARGIYHGRGYGFTAPVLVYSVEPEFSEKARKKKINGDCTLSVVVDSDGRVQDVHVVKSIADDHPPKLHDAAISLDQKAIESVKQYRFKPAMYQGKAVPTELEITVNFQIF